MSKLCATLDLSRGLRMDKQDNQKPLPDSHSGIDSGDGSTVVYCGNAVRVSEGFAIALQLMGMMHVDTGSRPDDSQCGE
jgi:diaminopimelate epimerase